MEHDRFDALARSVAARRSRRGTLGWLGRALAGAVLAGTALRPARSEAQVLDCADQGCRCRASVPGACVPGLVCCPHDPNLPGGLGTCVGPSLCFGGICSEDGSGCPATCVRGANCLDCCSGFCTSSGLCGASACRSAGCDCIAGSLAPCDEGLACCPILEGILGGPGICAPRGVCG